MATITVLRKDTGAKLGKGPGSRDKAEKTATINSWTDRAGLVAGKHYKLKIDRATYDDVICATVGAGDPVATFTGVE